MASAQLICWWWVGMYICRQLGPDWTGLEMYGVAAQLTSSPARLVAGLGLSQVEVGWDSPLSRMMYVLGQTEREENSAEELEEIVEERLNRTN